jgi:hypothetical protein
LKCAIATQRWRDKRDKLGSTRVGHQKLTLLLLRLGISWRTFLFFFDSTLSDESEDPSVNDIYPTCNPIMALSGIKTAIWGPPSVERSLLIKLDSTVLIYFSLIWFLFGINRASYSTAYISGMKEDVGFQGKDFNYMSTIYLVCYAVLQMPSTAALTIVRPRYVFVLANTVWSVLTLITFRVEHVWQVFVLNGFEGAFSAIA